MDRTMMYFQTRSRDECNWARKACWWRTSYNRDGIATDEIIKEIISRFKDHPSIKIIDKLDRKTSISFYSIPLSCMKVRRMRYLCVEIYKTLNELNPGYMKDIFQVQQSAYSTRRPYNIKVPKVNQTTFGTRSIRYEGAKIWNHLPNSLKSAETLEIFKVWLKLGKVQIADVTFANI